MRPIAFREEAAPINSDQPVRLRSRTTPLMGHWCQCEFKILNFDPASRLIVRLPPRRQSDGVETFLAGPPPAHVLRGVLALGRQAEVELVFVGAMGEMGLGCRICLGPAGRDGGSVVPERAAHLGHGPRLSAFWAD